MVEGPNGLCWLHDPTRSEDRRRAASKAGRAKPNRGVADIKQRLSQLADDVLEGRVERATGAVVSQILNVYLRAVSVELDVEERRELVERLETLESVLGQRKGRYGA
ncbi:MAG: hypothetical protein M3305_05785 [Actinomycetota bacterium]|nr:hypothetical protein [Actinomycetota bacterium]